MSEYVLPVMATTGVLSALASYRPARRCIAPGPDVATHAPSLPVYFAYAHAMNAADSSCLTSTNFILSLRRRRGISPCWAMMTSTVFGLIRS